MLTWLHQLSFLLVTREQPREAQDAKGQFVAPSSRARTRRGNLCGTIFTGGDTNSDHVYGCGTVSRSQSWDGISVEWAGPVSAASSPA
jgi:hypothetical protein